MIVADLARAALMLAFGVVAAAGLPVPLLPIMAGLATAAGTAYPACTAASVPRLVPASELARANAVRAAVGPVCVVAGPAPPRAHRRLRQRRHGVRPERRHVRRIGARGRVDPRGSGVAARCAPDRRTDVGELIGRASALLARRPALRLVGADVLASFVYGVLTVALLLVARTLGLAAGGYGLLLGAAGLGSAVGTAVSARLDGRPHVLTAALLLVAAPPPALATSGCLAGVLVLAALGGAGAAVIEVMTETILQREMDDAVLARVYGFAFPAAVAGVCAGSAVAVPLISVVGLAPALGVVVAAVAAYALWLAVPAHRALAAAAP